MSTIEIQEHSVRGSVTDRLNAVVDGDLIAWADRDQPLGGWTVYRVVDGVTHSVPIDRRADVETFLHMIVDFQGRYAASPPPTSVR